MIRALAAPRLLLALLLLIIVSATAHAEPHTFQLTVGDALTSVDRYNAFLVSLGKQIHGVKLVPGGTVFAHQSCAGLGSVFRVGSIAMVSSPDALASTVTSRAARKALDTVFAAAGVETWKPPGLNAETNLPFWSFVKTDDRVKFAADAVTTGSGDVGLLGPEASAGVLRFTLDVHGFPDLFGRYRLMLELYGRTSSQDGALVKFGESRCFTFVDLAPIDLPAFDTLIHANVTNSRLLHSILEPRLEVVDTALLRRDFVRALDALAVIVSAIVSHAPTLITVPKARFLAEAGYRVRRGVEFSPANAQCGDGVRQTGEACDGNDLGGFTCVSVGFGSGTLACTADCHFDTSQCGGTAVCGNGIVEGTEECDNGAANSNTKPDACRTNCKRAYCGDGVIDTYEDCEGKNLNGETCVSLGYTSGKLSCDSVDCVFNEDNCND